MLNRLARERARELAELLAAGERLRAGQRRALSGGGADELRAAEGDLRAAARALRSDAERFLAAEEKSPPPPSLARLELLLRVTAATPGRTRDALSRGVLVREPELAPGELAGLAVVPGGRGAAPLAAADRRARPERGVARDDSRGRAEEREARRREERSRRERERRAALARREAERARAAAEREERAATAAAERAERARQRAAQAREEATRLAARLRELGGSLPG